MDGVIPSKEASPTAVRKIAVGVDFQQPPRGDVMRKLIGIVAAAFIFRGIWIAEGSVSNLQYLHGMLEVFTGLGIAHVAVEFQKFQNPNWRKRWLGSLKGYLHW